MNYIIAADEGINWAAKGTERILQNIRNLISTYRYELPYLRTIGLPFDLIDRPMDEVIPIMVAEIHDLISEWEPRAEVEDVIIDNVNVSGNLSLKVVVSIE